MSKQHSSDSSDSEAIETIPFEITVKSGETKVLDFADPSHECIVMTINLVSKAPKSPVKVFAEFLDFPSDVEDIEEAQSKATTKKDQICELTAENTSSQIDFMAIKEMNTKFSVEGPGDVKIAGHFAPMGSLGFDDEEEEEEEEDKE